MTKIIAEFCQNHNGDVNLLGEMIHAAAESGATYGKMQTIFASDLTKRERFEEGKMVGDKVEVIKRPYQSEYDRLKDLEVSWEQHQWFVDTCRKYNLKAMTTCFTRGSIEFLKKFDWDGIKVASYDCGAIPMLRELAENFSNIIVSTGATYDEEIEEASNVLKDSGVDYSLLHCVTIYPTPLNQIHLKRMNYLRNFADKVGLSEHTLVERDGIKASVGAIYEGADYIERHFTILGPDKTKDGPVSIKPENLRELVSFSNLSKDDQKNYLTNNVPEFEIMLGKEKRELSEQELLNRDYYRGRFATHVNEKVIYNWENDTL